MTMLTGTRRVLRFAVALAAGTAVLSASQQAGQAPVFRSRIDLVQLYAAVHDVDGKPVRGLGLEDFSVFDNNRAVRLEVVSEVTGRVFDGPEWSREHTVNVASNEPVEDKRLVVIVMDDARMSLLGSDRERVREIGRELVRNLAPDDLACVVFTATNAGAQDFTADRALLMQAVDSLGGGFGARDYPPVMAAYSVDVLRRVATTLAETPARRKMLVFVGTGQQIAIQPPNSSKPFAAAPPGARWSPDAFGVSGRVDALLKAAQKSGMAVYVIDQRASVRDQRAPSVQFVKDLARHTGGIAVVGEPQPREAVRRVMTDAGHYYVLGFRADPEVRPGLYRKIRVEVSRPGASVRSQTGYYPPNTKLGDEPLPDLPEAPTTAALAGALPTGSLPLQLALTTFAAPAPDGRSLRPQLGVNLEAGVPTGATSRPSGPVEMEVRVFDGEGRRQIAVITDRRRLLSTGQFSPMPVIDVPPGRYNVRVAIVDDERRLTGSVYGTVTVPDFSREQLSASEIFVIVPPEAAAPAGWRSGVSSVRRAFARTETVSLVMGLYSSRSPQTAAAQIEIVDATGVVVHRESREVVIGGGGGAAGTELRVGLPLARLPDGLYLAKIDVTAGKARVSRTLVFGVR